MSVLWNLDHIRPNSEIVVPGETIPELFRNAVAMRGDAVFLREKELGLWRSWSWRETEQAVREIAMGLASIGFEPGECASILSNTVVEWVLADLGDDQRSRYASVWTVSAQLVDERPDLVQRLVDAAVQASRWAQAHPEETVGIHAANLGVAPSAIGRGFGADFAQHLIPRLDDSALAVVDQTQQFLLDHNLLDHPVDLTQWAAPQFLTQSTTGDQQ